MKTAIIFLAEGFETMEAMSPYDILKRGNIDVKSVSVTADHHVTSSQCAVIKADLCFDEFLKQYDAQRSEEKYVMIFPGGLPGAENLANHAELMTMMKEHYIKGGTVAGICAAPALVLSSLPELKNKKFTCYDGFDAKMTEQGAEYVCKSVVTDKNMITGRGPGFATDFGLEILKHIAGEKEELRVKSEMLL